MNKPAVQLDADLATFCVQSIENGLRNDGPKCHVSFDELLNLFRRCIFYEAIECGSAESIREISKSLAASLAISATVQVFNIYVQVWVTEGGVRL